MNLNSMQVAELGLISTDYWVNVFYNAENRL